MRKIILGVVLLSIIGTVGYGIDRRSKHINGYCYAERQYLTDQELVNHVVQHLLETDKVVHSDHNLKEQSKYTIYNTLDDFYKTNPYCCTSPIGSNGERQTFRAKNYRAYSTHISYRRLSSGDKPYSSSEAFMNSCGHRPSFDPLHHMGNFTFSENKLNRLSLQ